MTILPKLHTILPLFTLAGLLVSSVILTPQISVQAAPFVDETFSGQTTSGWNFGNAPSSNPPCLTAASVASTTPGSIPACLTTTPGSTTTSLPDTNGDGALRLTSNVQNQAAFAYYNTPIPTNQGFAITFDLYSYNGTDADGFSFFMFDGNVEPTTAGGYGGSLGYAQRTGVDGLQGGWAGIGFDEYGNFSNNGESRGNGCSKPSPKSGLTKNAITVRGSGNGQNGYCYLTGTDDISATTGKFSSPTTQFRSDGIKKRVRVLISNQSTLSVEMDLGSGFVEVIAPTDLTTFDQQAILPDTLKFGFAGSTGGSTNIHELNNIIIQTAKPDLVIRKDFFGSFFPNQTGTYQLQVNNKGSAGTTTDSVTVSDELPDGAEFVSFGATDPNWDCNNTAGNIQCVWNDAMEPNDILPPIDIVVQFTQTVDFSITNTAAASTTGELEEALFDNTHTHTMNREQPPLDEENTDTSPDQKSDLISDTIVMPPTLIRTGGGKN